MKICVLQPDAAQTALASQSISSSVAYKNSLQLASLFPDHEIDRHQIDYVLLQKATLYRQLKALKRQNYDIFINLCRSFRDGDLPACCEVVASLEYLNLPHTSPATTLYDLPKQVMKHIAYFAGIDTPGFVVAESLIDAEVACRELQFPMFVKPAASGDCLGIDRQSYVTTKAELLNKTAETIADFDCALIEEYIPGREFTVLLAANPNDICAPMVYKPIEILFPEDEHFRTHDFQSSKPDLERYTPCTDEWLEICLKDAANRIFLESNQGGYACVDFRVDATGEIYFLEINAPCRVFATAEAAPADWILQVDPAGHAGFLSHIIAEGIQRHQSRQKKYRVQKSPIATYGIFAMQDLQAGEVIVPGESRPQRIATLSQIQSHWRTVDRAAFLRYTYPVSQDVMVLRHSDPADWLVQNHSCSPNTAYQGLDLIALRDIVAGTELTIDFATFRDENQLEFECQCRSPQCRGQVRLRRCDEREKANL